MSAKKYLIVIGGPTASGKTNFAIQLAEHYKTGILSCDSRQFYKEMSIGTAKPTPEELEQAPHYFIDHLSVSQPYSVGDYEKEALELLDRLFREKEVVILTGGSGLFIKAICEGLDDFPDVPVEVRQAIEKEHRQYGLEYLQEKLREKDPQYYKEVDLQNPHRLIRALSVIESSGQTFFSFRTQTKTKRPFQPIYLQLYWPRDKLYQRINLRVDKMMEKGLLEEARRLYPLKDHTALQTVGYQEFFLYFDQQITLEKAVELVKRNSRRYAKRQLTWMRREGFWKRFRPEETELGIQYVEACRESAQRIEREKNGSPENPLINTQFLKNWGLIRIKNEESTSSAFLQVTLNNYLIIIALPSAINPSEEWIALLTHECLIDAQDRPVYLYCPKILQTFFGLTGFQLFEPNFIPAEVKKVLSATLQGQPDFILMRK